MELRCPVCGLLKSMRCRCQVAVFDEQQYLRNNPDVAAGVSKGILPSGLWHYTQHGFKEKRALGLAPVVKESPVWRAYCKFAVAHPSIEDFSLFKQMMDRIKNGDNFHVARYNDGEWVFLLRIPPHYESCLRDNSHSDAEVYPIAQKLLSIISSKPPYYIGIDSNTRALRGLIVNKISEYKKLIEGLDLIYGDIFNAATIRHGISALLQPLSQRTVISVGPDYMQRLGVARHHIETPRTNCWSQADRLWDQLHAVLQQTIHLNPVVIYSCSMLAKLLLHQAYTEYGNRMTNLDIGSCIDPWCGIISRPWHQDLVAHYQLDAVIDPIYFRK